VKICPVDADIIRQHLKKTEITEAEDKIYSPVSNLAEQAKQYRPITSVTNYGTQRQAHWNAL